MSLKLWLIQYWDPIVIYICHLCSFEMWQKITWIVNMEEYSGLPQTENTAIPLSVNTLRHSWMADSGLGTIIRHKFPNTLSNDASGKTKASALLSANSICSFENGSMYFLAISSIWGEMSVATIRALGFACLIKRVANPGPQPNSRMDAPPLI